ncbi:MAG: hypothetical protein WC346_02245 [Methanogenium sp.]|jgi:hypothetical protein
MQPITLERERLIIELLEENYDIINIINLILDRKDGSKIRTSDYDLITAIVGVMTDEEVNQVLNEIENS